MVRINWLCGRSEEAVTCARHSMGLLVTGGQAENMTPCPDKGCSQQSRAQVVATSEIGV